MTSPVLTKNVTKQKATGSHFTPYELATAVARRLLKELEQQSPQRKNLNVLDPSCGDGELLLAFERESQNFDLKLIGVEEDRDSIESAKERLSKSSFVEFSKGDFLEMVKVQESLSLFDESSFPPLAQADVIIANPPYVRTQILGAEKAQKLANKFNLSGRVDLYHAFLVAMTHQLKPGGLLGVITSNRYLTTTGGTAIREFLNTNYEIIEILDLGDTKMFDAAVLPAVFIGRKKQQTNVEKSNTTPRFFRIYEANQVENDKCESVSSVYDLLDREETGTFYSLKEDKHYNISVGNLEVPENYKKPWVMATNSENSWLNTVDSNMKYRIEAIADVKVGIKTTADKVFIQSDWNSVPVEMRPETELLRPLLSADLAERWNPLEKIPSRKVLYTHEIRDGKRKPINLAQYRMAERYLESHRERLEGREYVLKANRMWYEIWVPHDPSLWPSNKVVFPDISPEPKFFFDTEGCLVDGNCYWIIPNKGVDNDILYLIMAVSNTRLMTKYHDIAFQNKLYAGRRRYLTQYVKKYPIPDPNSEFAKHIVSLAKQLVSQSLSTSSRNDIEEQIERYTALAFGVEPV